jgi:hypothetical protein
MLCFPQAGFPLLLGISRDQHPFSPRSAFVATITPIIPAPLVINNSSYEISNLGSLKTLKKNHHVKFPVVDLNVNAAKHLASVFCRRLGEPSRKRVRGDFVGKSCFSFHLRAPCITDTCSLSCLFMASNIILDNS